MTVTGPPQETARAPLHVLRVGAGGGSLPEGATVRTADALSARDIVRRCGVLAMPGMRVPRVDGVRLAIAPDPAPAAEARVVPAP